MNKGIHSILLTGVLIVLFINVTIVGSAQQRAFPTYQSMIDALKGLEPDETKVATVSNFYLPRETASFNFEEGTIVLCKPIGGKVRAALFKGKATLNYMPPTKIEREQLERQLGVQMIEVEIRSMMIFFADSTEQELRSGCVFSAQSMPSGMKSIIKMGLDGILHDESQTVDWDLAKTLLEEKDNQLFFAFMNTRKYDNISWTFNPYQDEQIQFAQQRSTIGFGYKVYEPINQITAQSGSPDENFTKGDFIIDRYVVDSKIKKDLEFSAKIKVHGTLSTERSNWLTFSLSEFIVVGSVKLNNDNLTFYAGADGNGSVWVQLPKTYKRGDSLAFEFECTSKNLLKRYGNWTYLQSSIGWYPSCGYKVLTYFDATFHVPESYTFVAVGDLKSSSVKDEIVTTNWVTSKKIRNYSFNIGVFSSKKIEDPALPNFMVHSLSTQHRENVMTDLAQSYKFYQNLYGELDLQHFDVTEIPFEHGEAFPGLLHLSYLTFDNTDNTGMNESFCSHEVAHQWWGIGVDFMTYHDQWISEAFADYSSMLYTQVALKDNKKFFNLMSYYRRKIIDKRKSLLGSSTKSGPISLGYRTRGSLTPGDYDLIVYKKGLWVLHMLRNMLLDVKTMKEDAFFQIMKNFFQAYKGKRATTDDFRKVIEEYSGEDVGWFFDQWVHSTEIPSYKFAFKVGETPDGKFKVTCKIKQEGVPPEFRMSIPIRIDFGNDRFARLRVLVTGEESTFDLPLLPMRPNDILFNDFESVLCEVETVGWKE